MLMTSQSETEESYIIIAPPRSPLGAIRALGRAISQLYNHIFLFGMLGLLLYLTLPTLVLPGVVIAAMYRLARQAQTSPAPEFGDIWPALRGTLPWAPLLFLGGLAGIVLVLFNMEFYAEVLGIPLLLPFWASVLVLWLSVGFYSFTVAAALGRPELRVVLRTAFLFVAGRPLSTLVVWICVPLLTVVSALLPLLLFFLPSLLALWATALTYPRRDDDQELEDQP